MTRTARPKFDPKSSIVAPRLRQAVRRKLLRWYDRHKRDLPWRRRENDPYAQWVAEVMLQQTRVETVVEYYRRFMDRFPDLVALADADHEEVLKRWEGLGYYRRILHLHRAAQILRQNRQGVPQTADELRRLPGVGEYTAAAIASIAFHQPEAAVDGNVARVLARLFAVPEDIASLLGRTRVKALARQLLSRTRPGDFNQAWMDLGSAICTPRTPLCDECPMGTVCVCVATNKVDEFPVRDRNRDPARAVTLVLAIFAHSGKLLVHQRPTGGLWSGLWEFPNVEASGRTSHLRLVRRLALGNALELCGKPRAASVVHHRLTHRALALHAYVVPVAEESRSANVLPPEQPRRWVTFRGFERLSVSTAHRRVLTSAKELLMQGRHVTPPRATSSG